MILRWLRRLFESREERVLRLYGCVCWCPVCGDILNDRAEVHHCPNEGLVCYWLVRFPLSVNASKSISHEDHDPQWWDGVRLARAYPSLSGGNRAELPGAAAARGGGEA